MCDSQQIVFFLFDFKFKYPLPSITTAVILYHRRSFRFPLVRYRHGEETFDSDGPRSVFASPRIYRWVPRYYYHSIFFWGMRGESCFLRYTDLESTIEHVRTWSRRSQGDIPNTTLTKPTANSRWTHTHTHHT